jgi:hypothetical protein
LNTDTLKDTATDTLDQVKRSAAPMLKKGRRQAGVLLDQGGELMDSVASRASETAADLGNSIISYTKKNPLTALLLAVGAGALLIGAVNSFQSRR